MKGNSEEGTVSLEGVQASLEKAWYSPRGSKEVRGSVRLALVWSCWTARWESPEQAVSTRCCGRGARLWEPAWRGRRH